MVLWQKLLLEQPIPLHNLVHLTLLTDLREVNSSGDVR
jgi:hypothetical protein